jgi:uncharacterized protein
VARIPALDVLRGVAILGTFATNVWLFAHPGGPLGLLLSGGAAGAVETGLRALSNGKFLALLTLLFGVGMEIQYRAAARRGTPWPGRYPLRAAVLLVEGLVHYLLVFEGDVLMGYAIASVLVALLLGRSDRAVRSWITGLGGLYAAALLALTALLLAAPDDPDPAPVPTGTASWPAQVAQRVELAGLYRVELLVVVPSAVVLFLVGSRLARAGVFEPDGRRLRARLAVVGLGVAFPLNLVTAFAGTDWFLVDRYLLPPVVALGLLGAGTELVARTRGGALRRSVAAVGRTALSCYVAQNVLASVLCYGWGLGLAGRLAGTGPGWVVALWLGVSGVLLVAAPWWLRRHDRGPLELLAHRAVAAVPARAG